MLESILDALEAAASAAITTLFDPPPMRPRHPHPSPPLRYSLAATYGEVSARPAPEQLPATTAADVETTHVTCRAVRRRGPDFGLRAGAVTPARLLVVGIGPTPYAAYADAQGPSDAPISPN